MLAVLAMLLLSLVALLKGGQPAQAIIGGSKVTDTKTYPFMAQVWLTFYSEANKTWYTQLACTGTLLDNNSVLTAAHCVDPLKPNTTISVVVGTTTANDTFHEGKNLSVAPPGQKFSVATPLHICCEKPRSGENYHPKGIANRLANINKGETLRPYDAAVLNLSQPVTLPNVKPIDQLAKPSDGNDLEKTNTPATAAGWGLTKNCDPVIEDPKTGKKKPNPDCKPANQLHKVEVPIRDNQDAWVINDFNGSVMIPAGGENGKDVCHGDSGGPLFVKDKSGNYTQIGIAASGTCVGGGTPGVWTEVNNPTIYNFITKAAGLGGANQGTNNKGGGNNKGSGNNKGGGANKGGGSQSGGNQGGNTTGSGSSTGADTTGSGSSTTGGTTGGGTTGSGGVPGVDCEAGSPGCGGTTGGSGSSTGADTTSADTTSGGTTGGATTTDPGSTTGGGTTNPGSTTGSGTTGHPG